MELLNQEIQFAFLVLTALLMGVADGAVIEPQCYWCGPLAEEVHNSRRASPCDAARPPEVTLCTRDQPYCAVVVTAPPYIESRVCTRYYQDECYARYCNTSNIWKMVCSCRGTLCNGAITQREYDAFSSITNLLARTNRTKRTSLSSRILLRLRKHPTSIRTREAENEVLDDTTNSSDMLSAPKNLAISVPVEQIPSTAAGAHPTHGQDTYRGIPMASNSNGSIITPLTMTLDFSQNHKTAAEMAATKETYYYKDLHDKDLNIKIPMLYPSEQPAVSPITVYVKSDLMNNQIDQTSEEIGSTNSTYNSKDKTSPMSTITTNMIIKLQQRPNPTISIKNKAVISPRQTIVLKFAIALCYFLY